MTAKEIASDMASFHNNEHLDWDKISYGYKTVTTEQALQYIQDTIDELQEMLKGYKK